MRRLWAWLGDHQKYVWAALYLGCIPGFALVYSRMNHAFYEQNSILEPSYKADGIALVDSACAAINHVKNEELKKAGEAHDLLRRGHARFPPLIRRQSLTL